MRTHRSTSPTPTPSSPTSFRSALAAVLGAGVAVGAVLTLGSSPAVAQGSPRLHAVDLNQPAFRSVVVGEAVVSLATLDLPGPVSVPTVPTTIPPVAPPAPVAVPGPPTSPLGGVWAELRQCESGGNYAIDTGNGYYGAYQFSATTWHGLGFAGLPNQAPPAVQDEAAVELQARSGWGQWPACSRRLGL